MATLRVARAVSWLFYFRAIQVGSVSQVAPIDKLSMPIAIVLAVLILHERPTRTNWVGILLIAGGAYLAIRSEKSANQFNLSAKVARDQPAKPALILNAAAVT